MVQEESITRLELRKKERKSERKKKKERQTKERKTFSTLIIQNPKK